MPSDGLRYVDRRGRHDNEVAGFCGHGRSGFDRVGDPPTCTHHDLRLELWIWLDDVVTWINHEYVWDTAAYIPSCWPEHPHLVHDLAVLADQRRRAGRATTSDALEDWHRYALPAFLDRMNARLKTHCEDGHQTSPSTSRNARHTSDPHRRRRATSFDTDARRT